MKQWISNVNKNSVDASRVSGATSGCLKWRLGVHLVTLMVVATPLSAAAYVPADCRDGRLVADDWWSLQLRDLRESSIRRGGPTDESPVRQENWMMLKWAQLPAVARQLVSARAGIQLTALAESVAVRWRRGDDMPSETSLLELAFYLGRYLPVDVQKAMSQSLWHAYGVGTSPESGWPADVAARLVGALAELGDSVSASKVATEWTIVTDAFETVSLEELAYVSYGLVGEDERTVLARTRLAQFLGQSCIVDKSVVETTSPVVWRVLARRLAPALSYEDCQLWSRMLQEAFFSNGVPKSRLGADGLQLYDALLALDDKETHEGIMKWLDQRAGWTGFEPYLLAWNLERKGEAANPYRRKLIEHITVEIIGRPTRIRQLNPRDWHATVFHLKGWLTPEQSQQWGAGLHAIFCKDLRSFSGMPDLDKYHMVKTVAKHLGHSEIRGLIADWINQSESWKDTRLSAIALLLDQWKDVTDDNRKAMARLAEHLSDRYFSSTASAAQVNLGEWLMFAGCLDWQRPEDPAREQWAQILTQTFASNGEAVAAIEPPHLQWLLEALKCLGHEEAAELLALEQRLRDKLGREPCDAASAGQLMDTIAALQVKRMAALPRAKHDDSWQTALTRLRKLAQVGGQLGAEGARSVEQLASELDPGGNLTGEQVFIDVLSLCSDRAAGFGLRMARRRFRLGKAAETASDDLRQTVQQAVACFVAGKADEAKDAYREALLAAASDGDQELVSLLRWALLDAISESMVPDCKEMDSQIAALRDSDDSSDGDLAYFTIRSLVNRISGSQASRTGQFEAGLRDLPFGPVWIDQHLLDALVGCFDEIGNGSLLMSLTKLMLIVDDVPSLRRIQVRRVQLFLGAGDSANARRGNTLHAVLGLVTPEGPFSDIGITTGASADVHKLVRHWVEAGNEGATVEAMEVDEPLRAAAKREETVSAQMAAWLLSLSGDVENAGSSARAALKAGAPRLDERKRDLLFVSLILAGSEVREAARTVNHDSRWYGRWQNWPILWGARAISEGDADLAMWAWAMAIDGAARAEDASQCVESLMALAGRSGLSESLLAALTEVPVFVHSSKRDRDVWLQLAGHFYQAGEFSATVACFERADASGPAITDERALTRRIQLVTAMSLLGRYAEALAILEETQTWPKRPEGEALSLFLRAWLCTQLSQWEMAHSALEQLAQRNAGGSGTEEAAKLTELIAGHLSTKMRDGDYDHQRLTSLLSELTEDPAGQVFMERLRLLERAARDVGQVMETHRQLLLKRLLAQAVDLPTSLIGSHEIADAKSLYERHAPSFAHEIPIPPIGEDDLSLLRKHYDRVVSNAVEMAFLQGSDVVALDHQVGPDIGCLCLVLPMLTGAQRPSPQQFATAPEWFRRNDVRRTTEAFAISLGRPLVALSLASSGSAHGPEVTMDRLEKMGERLTYAYVNYPQAITCLDKMTKIATEANLGDRAVVGAIALAEVYSRMGQPGIAAGAIGTILTKFPMAENRHRAAALRLQYLHTAKQFSAIVDEWKGYCDSSISAAHKGTILYLAWDANRRLNRSVTAGQLATQFLETFPDHPWGASVHLAMAMDALVSRDYVACQEQLELIELRYPDTSLLPRVRQIQEQLKTAHRRQE